MLTDKQIATQLKRQIANAKRENISRAMEAILHILHESPLFGSTLWPKNGFKAGYFSGFLDTITVGIRIDVDSGWKLVRFNLWGKEPRVKKQYKQMVLIFDQAYFNGIHFTPLYPEHLDRIAAHYHDGHIMGMLDFIFTIDE